MRPEDVLRRVAGTGHIKAAVFKEGASDLEIQNLRDAYAAGAEIKPVEVTLDKDGNVIDSQGLHARMRPSRRASNECRTLSAALPMNVMPTSIPFLEVAGRDRSHHRQANHRARLGPGHRQGRCQLRRVKQETQGRVIRTALGMKVDEKTQNSPTATVVRKPSLQPTPKVIVKSGKMYWDVSDYKSGPDVFNRFRFRAADQNGDPVFERANVKIHPDYHKPIMQAFQDTSWFRKNPIARLALGSSGRFYAMSRSRMTVDESDAAGQPQSGFPEEERRLDRNSGSRGCRPGGVMCRNRPASFRNLPVISRFPSNRHLNIEAEFAHIFFAIIFVKKALIGF